MKKGRYGGHCGKVYYHFFEPCLGTRSAPREERERESALGSTCLTDRFTMPKELVSEFSTTVSLSHQSSRRMGTRARQQTKRFFRGSLQTGFTKSSQPETRLCMCVCMPFLRFSSLLLLCSEKVNIVFNCSSKVPTLDGREDGLMAACACVLTLRRPAAAAKPASLPREKELGLSGTRSVLYFCRRLKGNALAKVRTCCQLFSVWFEQLAQHTTTWCGLRSGCNTLHYFVLGE